MCVGMYNTLMLFTIFLKGKTINFLYSNWIRLIDTHTHTRVSLSLIQLLYRKLIVFPFKEIVNNIRVLQSSVLETTQGNSEREKEKNKTKFCMLFV